MPIFWLLRVNRRDEQFSVFYSVRFSWWFCNFAAEWKSLVIENPVDRSRPNHNLKSRRWKWQSLQQGVNWLIGMAAPRKVTRRSPLVFCFENSDFGWLASVWWEHSASIVPSAISFWISFFFFFLCLKWRCFPSLQAGGWLEWITWLFFDSFIEIQRFCKRRWAGLFRQHCIRW